MRRVEAVALLLGPSVLVAAVTVGTRLDDDHMSAADVRQFCASYRLVFADDAGRLSEEVWERTVHRLYDSASDNLKDDIRVGFGTVLGLGPQDKSGADAGRANARIDRTAATRCD